MARRMADRVSEGHKKRVLLTQKGLEDSEMGKKLSSALGPMPIFAVTTYAVA